MKPNNFQHNSDEEYIFHVEQEFEVEQISDKEFVAGWTYYPTYVPKEDAKLLADTDDSIRAVSFDLNTGKVSYSKGPSNFETVEREKSKAIEVEVINPAGDEWEKTIGNDNQQSLKKKKAHCEPIPGPPQQGWYVSGQQWYFYDAIDCLCYFLDQKLNIWYFYDYIHNAWRFASRLPTTCGGYPQAYYQSPVNYQPQVCYKPLSIPQQYNDFHKWEVMRNGTSPSAQAFLNAKPADGPIISALRY